SHLYNHTLHDALSISLYSVGVANHFGSFGDQNNLGLRPLVYEPYLKKYGIRRLHRFSNYIGAGSSNGEPPTEVARRYHQDLFNRSEEHTSELQSRENL